MLIACVTHPTQLTQDFSQVDALECRFDLWPNYDIAPLESAGSVITRPMIFTLRSEEAGGKFIGSETERLAALCEYVRLLQPAYIDCEMDVSTRWIDRIKAMAPNAKLIRSYHNFEHTPQDLNTLYQRMSYLTGDHIKIVCHAQDAIDGLRLMQFRKALVDPNLTVHAMGEAGQFTRIMGVALGNAFCYASVEAGAIAAPGLISSQEFMNEYRIKQVDSQTRFYGLIGDPVKQSQGDKLHNAFFLNQKQNAVYVKIPLAKKRVPEFFQHIKGLPFRGFSVTMPLKQTVLSVLTEMGAVHKIGACNTIEVLGNKIAGHNTDGAGAIQALGIDQTAAGKTLLVLGAGGAARAIVSAVHEFKLETTILNRSLVNAIDLAKNTTATAYTFEKLPQLCGSFDFIVNTLPQSVGFIADHMDWLKTLMDKSTTVMDINYTDKTAILLQLAEQTGAKIIHGQAMFEAQAVLQQKIWASCETIDDKLFDYSSS